MATEEDNEALEEDEAPEEDGEALEEDEGALKREDADEFKDTEEHEVPLEVPVVDHASEDRTEHAVMRMSMIKITTTDYDTLC